MQALQDIGALPGALEAALGVALALAVGRVVLSLLPPGSAGSHHWRELPLTAALSWMLGDVALLPTNALLGAVGVVQPYVAPALWLAVGVVRWRLGPHAFVPRREPESPRVRGALLLAVALLATCAWPMIEARTIDTAHLQTFGERLLLAILTSHGFASARRAQIGRGLLVALLLTTPVLLHDDGLATHALALVAMGVSCSVGWLRRADRRERVLALIAFAATTEHSPLLWLAGFAALIGVTHPNARKATLVAALAAIALVILPLRALLGAWFVQPRLEREGAELAVVLRDTEAFGALLVLGGVAFAAALAGMRGGQLHPPPAEPGEVEAPRRELFGCAVFLLVALALQWAQPAIVPESMRLDGRFGVALLLPAVVLLCGLVALRAEGTPAPRR